MWGLTRPTAHRHRGNAGDERLGAQRRVLDLLPDRPGARSGCGAGGAGRADSRGGAAAGAAAIVALGCFALTVTVNVPMNEALARRVPDDRGAAAAICAGYSPRWQLFTAPRTGAAGLALLLNGLALWRLPG